MGSIRTGLTPMVTNSWSGDLLHKIAVAREQEKVLAEEAERTAAREKYLAELWEHKEEIEKIQDKNRVWREKYQQQKAMRRLIKW